MADFRLVIAYLSAARQVGFHVGKSFMFYASIANKHFLADACCCSGQDAMV
jgi:hypothetical protein